MKKWNKTYADAVVGKEIQMLRPW